MRTEVGEQLTDCISTTIKYNYSNYFLINSLITFNIANILTEFCLISARIRFIEFACLTPEILIHS